LAPIEIPEAVAIPVVTWRVVLPRLMVIKAELYIGNSSDQSNKWES